MQAEQGQDAVPASPAILFLVFNRPETTRQVFEAIRAARPARLYVAADGPREGVAADDALCRSAREIATAVDWPCEVRTLMRKSNLRCGVAVSSAIDWFFEHEEAGIILEDDCVPHADFFRFAAEMLVRWRDDDRVMLVSGGCPLPAAVRPSRSYFFSGRVDIWGWATWRRAWRHNDRAMPGWRALREGDWLLRIGGGHRDFRDFWTAVFDAMAAGRPDVWGYQWVYSVWRAGGISIVPSRNLVSNIGFGPDATHTKDDGGAVGTLPLEPIEFPLMHPHPVAADASVDRWLDRKVYLVGGLPLWRRALRKFRRAGTRVARRAFAWQP